MIVLRYNIGRSFLFFSGVQIQAHDFQGQTLFIESIGLFHLRFCYHATQGALLPFLIVSLLPKLLGLLQRLLQVLLVLSVIQQVGEIIGVGVGHIAIIDLNATGTDYNVQRLTQFHQIAHCTSKRVQDRLSDVSVQLARSSDRHWVTENHIEPLLVDRVLTLRLGNFFLARVAQQHFLKTFVRDKAGTNLVVVQTFFSLIGQFFGDIEVGVLGRFDDIGVYFEGEGSEVAVVDTSATDDVFLDVFSE